MTVTEMAAELGIEPNAVRQRLFVAGIKLIVKEALYTPDTLERIRNVPPRGRPKKPKPKDAPVERECLRLVQFSSFAGIGVYVCESSCCVIRLNFVDRQAVTS